MYLQIVKGSGEEYLDVHIGEIVQLTWSWRRQNGKGKHVLLDRALIDEPHVHYTMRWYEAMRKDPKNSFEPLRHTETGEKLYTIPLTCKEGYNWAVHNSDAKNGIVLTKVSITQIAGTSYWGLDKDCEIAANQMAIDSMRDSCGEEFACVGDGRGGMTTKPSQLRDIEMSVDGKQDEHTREVAQRARAARVERGQKAAATRKQNKEKQQQLEAVRADQARMTQEQGNAGRAGRVAHRGAPSK